MGGLCSRDDPNQDLDAKASFVNTTSQQLQIQKGFDPNPKTAAKSKAEKKEADERLFSWTKDPIVTQNLDFDKWYPILSENTMKSLIIDCTNEEISAILTACEANRDDVIDNIHTYNENKNEDLPQDVQATLNTLAEKIDSLIDKHNLRQSGIFVRFSHRSPKDSVLRLNKTQFEGDIEATAIELYKEYKENKEDKDKQEKHEEEKQEKKQPQATEERERKTGNMKDDNDGIDVRDIDIKKCKNNSWNSKEIIVNCIMRSMAQHWSKKLCVYNGNDAIKMTIYSRRIYYDFKIGQLLNGNDFKTKLIIRQFKHNIDFECEFRTFIFKGNLCAISQYNYFICLKKIVENKDKILNSIQLFWKNKIHPRMVENNITSYIMDVGLVNGDDNDNEKENENENENEMKCDSNSFKMVLIEINPFITKAGTLLFDWKKDVESLTSYPPVSMRVLENPFSDKPPKFNSQLDSLYHKLFDKLNHSV